MTASGAGPTDTPKTEAENGAAIAKKPPTRMDILKKHFDAWLPTLKAVLPKHIDPQRVVKIAMGVYLNKPELALCSPLSMVKATVQCAELGLDPSPLLGEAYFVPFNATVKVKDGNTFKERKELQVQLIPGYVGLAKLAKQTGEVSDVYAVPVFESELVPVWSDDGRLLSGFYCEDGTERRIRHVRKLNTVRGELAAVYGVVKFKDNTNHFELLSKEDIEAHRKVSQQPDGMAWKNNYIEMAKKTAIRMTVKMVPKSTEKPGLAHAVALDEANEMGEAFRGDLASDSIDTTGDAMPDQPADPPAPMTRTEELAKKLGADPQTGELPHIPKK